MTTCSTFALYTSTFTKSASRALAVAAQNPAGDQEMAKRWDVLGKFETNFNHWFKVIPDRSLLGLLTPDVLCSKVHLDCVQFYASSENVSLLPLVVRLNSIKTSA